MVFINFLSNAVAPSVSLLQKNGGASITTLRLISNHFELHTPAIRAAYYKPKPLKSLPHNFHLLT